MSSLIRFTPHQAFAREHIVGFEEVGPYQEPLAEPVKVHTLMFLTGDRRTRLAMTLEEAIAKYEGE